MSGLPINDLAKAIADATGWVQHIAELNAALKPLVSGEVNLDTLSQQLDDAQARLDGLAHDIKLREDVLASVNERITLADTNRQLSQVKADAASVIAKLTAAEGGSANVDPK